MTQDAALPDTDVAYVACLRLYREWLKASHLAHGATSRGQFMRQHPRLFGQDVALPQRGYVRWLAREGRGDSIEAFAWYCAPRYRLAALADARQRRPPRRDDAASPRPAPHLAGSRLTDRVVVCVACGGDFLWTVAEQRAARPASPPPGLGPRCRWLYDDALAARAREVAAAAPQREPAPTAGRVPETGRRSASL